VREVERWRELDPARRAQYQQLLQDQDLVGIEDLARRDLAWRAAVPPELARRGGDFALEDPTRGPAGILAALEALRTDSPEVAGPVLLPHLNGHVDGMGSSLASGSSVGSRRPDGRALGLADVEEILAGSHLAELGQRLVRLQEKYVAGSR